MYCQVRVPSSKLRANEIAYRFDDAPLLSVFVHLPVINIRFRHPDEHLRRRLISGSADGGSRYSTSPQ